MARTTKCTEEEKTLLISPHNQDQEDYEDEEALSLCDLPVSLTKENVQFKQEDFDSGFEFRFGSLSHTGSDTCKPEMSTAEELFSNGRFLPFRHSVSLDAITRSESVEFKRTGIEPDRKLKNNFIGYSQQSPRPQIRRSSSMSGRVNTLKNPSIWDFLRLGLVHTPEIELRSTLTAGNARLSVSRNSSCSSTSTSSRKSNRRRSFWFTDCKCSVATEIMEPVKIKEREERQRMIEKKTAKKEEKTAIARSRTFDWLKELSQEKIF